MNPQDENVFLVTVFFEDENCVHFVGVESTGRRDSDVVNIAIQLGLKSSPDRAAKDERIKSLKLTRISPAQFETLRGAKIPSHAVGGLKLWRVNTAKFIKAMTLIKQNARGRRFRLRPRRTGAP